MEGSNSLKSSQMALVTFITQTGVGVLLLPAVLSKEAGHDGWLSILATGIVVVILSMLIIKLLKRYSDRAIYDINKLIFGEMVGVVFNGLMVFYLLIATVAGASLFNYFIRITLLQETPPWALAPFITLPSFYLVWYGLKHMSRFLFCSIISYIVIIIFIVFLFKDFRFSFLMPIGEAGIGRILYSTKTSFFAFIGFELIAFFYPYITDKNKALKWHVGASLVSMIFFMVVYVVSILVYGENLLSILSMPFFDLSRVYNAPILERVDLYLIALWFIPTACSMRNYIFAAFDGLQKVFKVKKTRKSYVVYFIFILVISSLPQDINQVLKLIELINIAGIGLTIFLIFCLVLSFIRKKGVVTK